MNFFSKSAKQSLQGMVQTAFTGNGAGTAENSYQITTEAELKEITGGINTYYKLMNDIPLKEAWTPIRSFAGTLEGNGFKITNLTIETTVSAGLFDTNQGAISNLGVEVVSIEGNILAGTIAATNNGEITNCFVTGGTISAAEGGCVGGIVGLNNKAISNCYVALDLVRIINLMPNGSNINLGGIAGEMTAGGSVKYCLVANKEMSVENVTGNKYANYIVGGYHEEGAFFDDNKLNFFSHKVLRTGLFYNMTYPFDPRGMTGLLWLGSFPTDKACNWAKNEAGRFHLKRLADKPIATIDLSDHLYLDGKGTTDAPYQIKNEANLIKLRDYVNNGGSREDGFCYTLANDITMSDAPFLPIGKSREGYNVAFCGIFEGAGRSIKNLKLNNAGINDVGLFGSIGGGAVIKNLAVTDCSIHIKHIGNASLFLAPIVGNAASTTAATIENCYAIGTIHVISNPSVPNAGSAYVGGIAGAIYNCTITSCYSDVNITVDVQVESDISYVGGIAGLTVYGGTVTNCLAKGAIEAKAEAGGMLHCGGILGEYFNPTRNCLALNPSIKVTTLTTPYVSQIALKNWQPPFDPSIGNYASQKMKLFKNGARYTPVPDTEELGEENGEGIYVEEDAAGWRGELPSDDAWEKTDDGYVNLKSIATTFGLKQQIKLIDYVPFTICFTQD